MNYLKCVNNFFCNKITKENTNSIKIYRKQLRIECHLVAYITIGANSFLGTQKKTKTDGLPRPLLDVTTTSHSGAFRFGIATSFGRRQNIPFRSGTLGPRKDVHTTSGAIWVLERESSMLKLTLFYSGKICQGGFQICLEYHCNIWPCQQRLHPQSDFFLAEGFLAKAKKTCHPFFLNCKIFADSIRNFT